MKQSEYSAVSLFSGCGGSDLGLRDAGIAVSYAVEKSDSACRLYERLLGTRVIERADIRDLDVFPSADILAGCYPCQGYSQGGRRSQADSINFLYREFDRALRRIRPLAFIVENVDGMRFAHNNELLGAQLTRFRSAGYVVAVGVLNGKDFGLAQDRKRLFLVGIKSSEGKRFTFPAATHGDVEGLSRPRTLRDVIWHLRDAPAGSYCDEPLHWYYMSRNRRRSWDEQANCVVAHWRHAGLHPDSPPLKKVRRDCWKFAKSGFARRYSYLECAALQGFPAPTKFSIGSVRQRFRAIGNAVPPPLFATVAKSLISQLRTPRRRR